MSKLASHKIDRQSAKQALFQEGSSLLPRSFGSHGIMIRVGFCVQAAKELTHFFAPRDHNSPTLQMDERMDKRTDGRHADSISTTCPTHVALKMKH